VKPYEGSTITDQEEREFAEMDFVVGKGKEKPRTEHLEGKYTLIVTDDPKGRTALEKSKNYESALKSAGFDIAIACSNRACGEFFMQGINNTHESGTRYLAARLKRAEGEVWVAVKCSDDGSRIVVLEAKPMETDKVKIDAAALKKGIESEGHIAVYGIVFDTNKAELKPQASPILEEIARLLQENPALKLHVVGHTDNVGELGANMDLSRRRADAVVKALVSSHSIAAGRLRADGVGPLCAVASNRNDAGRAKNRRVDLVEQ
jgi:outer membrane protein OmpA-like peptidoglycan-associated protein